MTEERVTIKIIEYLKSNKWEIVCFDYPQSGTGISIHLNEDLRTSKNKGAIIPDIIALKNNNILFFENKDRFVFNDFIKIENLRINSHYFESINRLLSKYEYSKIYYGVGMPQSIGNIKKTLMNIHMIDFALFVNEEDINIEYQTTAIFY